MNKKFLLFFAALILILLGFLALWLLKTPNGGPSFFPTPTPVRPAGGKEGAADHYENASPRELKKANQSYLVGQLIPKLPYHDANFSLYYNFGTNQFILYINPSAVSAGNAEFDTFLKQNGVEERLWIENLTVINKNVTPAP